MSDARVSVAAAADAGGDSSGMDSSGTGSSGTGSSGIDSSGTGSPGSASPGTATFRFTGTLAALSPADRALLMDRSTSSGDDSVSADTAAIVRRVRQEGDDALRDLARRFDRVEMTGLEVAPALWDAALQSLSPELRGAMERAARNITTAHRVLLPEGVEIETEPGVLVGRRPDPLDRVGVYAPGGRATYPSSVLMGAIPARVAGVREIVLCSPPGPDGLPAAPVLAAARLAGVDRVFAIGGAGAIAAMAYGTATVPRVDRIVGPGNAWVAEAKLQCAGAVAIDSPAGPSELLVIADRAANPEVVARELLAQAEHDPRAAVVLVAIGRPIAVRVAEVVARLLPLQQRREITTESLATRGGCLVAQSVNEAIAFANAWAAEHLLVATADPQAILRELRNAGTVFLGEASSVAFGDYMTGGNHVLPTGGLARSYSGLSTLDFVRWTSYQRVTPEAAARLAADVGTFADAEGLPAHAAAARQWKSA